MPARRLPSGEEWNVENHYPNAPNPNIPWPRPDKQGISVKASVLLTPKILRFVSGSVAPGQAIPPTFH